MLKTLRIEKKLTQTQLSKLSGLSQNYISEMENYPALSNPTVGALISLSEALNVDNEILYKFFVKAKLENRGKNDII